MTEERHARNDRLHYELQFGGYKKSSEGRIALQLNNTDSNCQVLKRSGDESPRKGGRVAGSAIKLRFDIILQA